MASDINQSMGLDLERRMTSAEVEIHGLRTDMHESSERQRGDMILLNKKLDKMADSLTDRNKTSWATLAAWAAVIISVIALAGSGWVRDLNRVETQLAAAIEDQEGIIMYVKANTENEVSKAKATLLREVTLLKEASENRDDELSQWLTIVDTQGPRDLNILVGEFNAVKKHLTDISVRVHAMESQSWTRTDAFNSRQLEAIRETGEHSRSHDTNTGNPQ